MNPNQPPMPNPSPNLMPNPGNIPQSQPAARPLNEVAAARAQQASMQQQMPIQVPSTQAFNQPPQPMMQPSVQPVGIPQANTPQAIGSATQNVPAAAPTNATPDNPISTQSTLLISELRDGLVIMKDGSFRAVVACQSINFDLMSETEREGVEYSYQNFLNSLTFTIQILARSQRVDIGPYIERLTERRRTNDNMLLGVLMDDYINFIDILAQEANIMDKSFFIVISYYSSADAEKLVQETKNFFKTFTRNKGPAITRINREVYDKAIDELNNRVDAVVAGLYQIGIQSARLNTRELSQLYYNFNNPDTAVREPLVDFTKIATTYVRKGEKNV